MSKFEGTAKGRRNLLKDKAFKVFGLCVTLVGVILLSIFIFKIVQVGWSHVDLSFIENYQSRRASRAGIRAAWQGTIWIFVLTALIGVPFGIAAGVFLEEYGKKSRFSTIFEINISNLAGVPSVIYGLLGLSIFVYTLGMGASILAGSFTLALLILPIIVVSTREAIRAVPDSIRKAAYGLGATKWQTIWTQVLPSSIGGILTGSILALSRVVGETAPLIMVGAAASIRFDPEGPMSQYTVLPLQIYDWTGRPQEEFQAKAAAGIIILLLITFVLNGIAVYFRNKWQKKINW